MQNLTVEFATLGDLKLVERPAPHTLGPHGFHHIAATIKVSSTETGQSLDRSYDYDSLLGVVFGNIVYDKQGAADASVNIVMNDIHCDILSFVEPNYVPESQVS